MQEQSNQPNSVIINAQYTKDLSFENPKSPYSLMQTEQPKIEVGMSVDAQHINENMFEVVINTRVAAMSKEEIVFILELQYAGLFVVEHEQKEVVLFVHCPGILFPYVRRIVSDIISDGGYPPLMLTPVDFMGIYRQRQESSDKPGTSQ